MIPARIAVRWCAVLLCGFCGCLAWTASHRVWAYAEGPPNARTGAPGEGTCHDCHANYDINDPSGSVTIGGLPDSYVPGGDPVTFTVTLAQDGTNGANVDWGFETTVLDADGVFACDQEPCDSTLLPTDGNTQTGSGLVGGLLRYYVKQTIDGIFYNADGAPSATWTISWTPPSTDIGPVTFYVAGNAANGDFLFSGDYIFVNSRTVLGPGAFTIARARQLVGAPPRTPAQSLAGPLTPPLRSFAVALCARPSCGMTSTEFSQGAAQRPSGGLGRGRIHRAVWPYRQYPGRLFEKGAHLAASH